MFWRLNRRRLFYVIGFIAILGLIAIFGGYEALISPNSLELSTSSVSTTESINYTLLFVGDVMLSRGIGAIIDHKQNPSYPFLLIDSATRAVDLAFANLENPISTGGKNQGSEYSFRADPESAILALQYAGFDVVNLANNHIWDYGSQAALDTMKYLREAGIGYVGFGRNYEEANSPVIKKVGENRIAFLGYTEFYSSSLWADDQLGLSEFEQDKIAQRVSEIKKAGQADIVVVSFHWGEEYKSSANDTQRLIAHALVDAGADLVIGHHPHVAQEVERYEVPVSASGLVGRVGYIAYSLGNFVFDQNFSPETRRGLMLSVTIKDGKVLMADSIEIGFSKEYQPYVLSSESSADSIK